MILTIRTKVKSQSPHAGPKGALNRTIKKKVQIWKANVVLMCAKKPQKWQSITILISFQTVFQLKRKILALVIQKKVLDHKIDPCNRRISKFSITELALVITESVLVVNVLKGNPSTCSGQRHQRGSNLQKFIHRTRAADLAKPTRKTKKKPKTSQKW